MGTFLNEFAPNLQIAVAVFVTVSSPTFGYFYNRVMDSLKDEHEHMSMYVALGTAVTLGFIGLISWKAALLGLVVFMLTGAPMIIGEYKRTEKKKRTPRRKRLPYAANGLLDQAKMASLVAHEKLIRASSINSLEEIYKLQRDAALEMTTIIDKLSEVKQIQLEK